MRSHPASHREEAKERFQSYLRQQGLRQTPERFQVLDALYAMDGHTDADALYDRLQQQERTISRATVYNTLNLLLACDLVVRHQFGEHGAKYEPSLRYRQHDHLICLDCQEVLEFCDPRIQRIQDLVAEVYHFEITRAALNLYGHCRRDRCTRRPLASPAPGSPA